MNSRLHEVAVAFAVLCVLAGMLWLFYIGPLAPLMMPPDMDGRPTPTVRIAP
jgi:hypothetical protein